MGPIVWTCGTLLGISTRKFLVAATLLVSIALAPLIPMPVIGDPVVLVVRELAVGLTMAWVGRTIYAAAEMAGSHVGRDLGLGEAETLLGEGGAGAGALGGILVTWIFLAALLLGGGDLVIVKLMARSYELIPPGSSAPGAFGPAFAHVLDGAMRAAWVAAAPSLAVSTAIIVGLGMVGRAAPQFNAYVASYPLRIGLVFSILLVAFPIMVQPLMDFMDKGLELILESVAIS